MRGKSGRLPIVFSASDAYVDLPVQMPCGKCIGCQMQKAREWAVRIMHEASLHEENSFVTLTYSDENLPEHGSLRLKDFQLFMKRLRKARELKDPKTGKTIHPTLRYFHCGEYGGTTGRPHYHAVLFGEDFSRDRYPYKRGKSGELLYRSPRLDELWENGDANIGEVTFNSAAYVARYVTKKVNGAAAEDHYRIMDPETGEEVELKKEYATMSRRPGLGQKWFEQYWQETYRDDTVIVNGKPMLPPKYYDRLMEEKDFDLLEQRKAERRQEHDYGEDRPDRLACRHEVARARLKVYSKREG